MGEVFYNSEFINEEEIVIKISNRAFNYGDGFFETIKIINTKPFNFSTHYLRFSFACKVLKLKNNETENKNEKYEEYVLSNHSIHISVFIVKKIKPTNNDTKKTNKKDAPIFTFPKVFQGVILLRLIFY